MKKYNIAFTGVFDIENYGDHLFPLIFREKMKKKALIQDQGKRNTKSSLISTTDGV